MTRWALTLVLVFAWEILGRALVTDPRTALLVPLPTDVARVGWGLLRDGSLLAAVARSAARVGAGALLAIAIGVPIGASIARSRRGGLIEGPLRLLRPIPPVAWVPLTILWLGVTELQQVAVLTVAATFVVATGTAQAVAGVPARLLLAARNLGADERTVTLKVAVYAAFPGIAATVREAVGTAWYVLVAAELLSAGEGLGVLVLEGRDMLEPARTFVGMGALAVCGAGTDRALAALQARIGRWA